MAVFRAVATFLFLLLCACPGDSGDDGVDPADTGADDVTTTDTTSQVNGTDVAQNDGATGSPTKMTLGDVRFWAYNIQDVQTTRQWEELVGTHFDLYVLEVVTTQQGDEGFDIAGLVRAIREHNIATRNVDPLILAYVDIGEAEDWRWYWDESWSIGDPTWIVANDPNDWAGNYPVAFWDPTWVEITITGYQGQSHIEATLAAGFDGIYMDWVEAYSDDNVVAHAVEVLGLQAGDAARAEVASLMFDFIEEMGTYARTESDNANPDYLVVAQNSSDLYAYDPTRYEEVIDGIALEAIWWDGDGGFDDWADPTGYNVLTNDLYSGWTEEVVSDLSAMSGRVPIFCVEYAQDVGEAQRATEVYQNLAPTVPCIPYATRRSLGQLSTTPYPPGYGDADY